VLKIGVIVNGFVEKTHITCGANKNTQRNTTEKIIPTIESALDILALFFGTVGKSSKSFVESILIPCYKRMQITL
jgi:hypothetical protein